MRQTTKAILGVAMLLIAVAGPGLAQDDSQVPQYKLTEETLKGVIAATKEMQALDPGEASADQEGAETTELDAQFDTIARKYGFADAQTYGQAFESAVQAFTVLDWTSEQRKQEAASEIAAVKADPELDDAAKKEAIALIEQELTAPPPPALPENVELMKAHEAEMRELMTSDIGP